MTKKSLGTLLIVDDEAAHLEALCNTLSDHGYRAVGCASGEEALDVLRAREFDVLLTDLKMPNMDGIALLSAALEMRPQLAGVLMTGHGTISTAVEAMKVGALDYILKPFKLSAALPVLSRAMAVRKLRAENAALEKSLREHAAELEAANADLEAFSSSVAHDLRGPLKTIGGFVELIQARFSVQIPAEAGRMLGHIMADVKNMGALIEGLLQFSRLGRQPLSKQRLDVTALVREIVDGLSRQHNGRSIEIHIHELPACVGDPLLMRQVFINLLANAFKFTGRKQRAVIEVGYQANNGEAAYFVRDNGAGFDMSHARKLFGIFQRLHGGEQFEGTGVGLSIVHRIVLRHGGRIWADAEPDKGATFYVAIPG